MTEQLTVIPPNATESTHIDTPFVLPLPEIPSDPNLVTHSHREAITVDISTEIPLEPDTISTIRNEPDSSIFRRFGFAPDSSTINPQPESSLDPSLRRKFGSF